MPKDYEDIGETDKEFPGIYAVSHGGSLHVETGTSADMLNRNRSKYWEISTSNDGSVFKPNVRIEMYGGKGRTKFALDYEMWVLESGVDAHAEIKAYDYDGNLIVDKTLNIIGTTIKSKQTVLFDTAGVPLTVYINFWSSISGKEIRIKFREFEMSVTPEYSLPAGTNNIGNVDIASSVDVEKNLGTMSSNNSSTTPLGIGGVFTGTAEDIKDYAAINVSIFADQDSAADGLSIEWSQDGTNWDEVMTVGIAANKAESYEFGVRARYFRIVYTNGGTAQGAFRLQVIYHPVRTREGARCLCVDIDPREFAKSVRAILAAKKPDGVYTNIHATAGGNLKTAVEEFDCSLPAGTNNIGDVDIASFAVALPSGTNTIGKIDLNPLSSCASGQTDVTTAGTAVVLATSTACKSVTIKAKADNTNNIYVGDSGVTSANGFILGADDTVSVDVDNLADMYIDSDTNGEGVSYVYVV